MLWLNYDAVTAAPITLSAASPSFAVGWINDAGNMKPYLPLSLSSMVYVYFIPTTPLAQSSEPPEAG